MKIGQGIIKICNLKGINQQQLAKLTGKSATFHSLIENGHREPSIFTLKKIAKALNVPVPVIIWLSLDTEDLQMGDPELVLQYKNSLDSTITKIFVR